MEMDLNLVWQDFGLDRLQEGILRLFPERRLNLEELLGEVMTGDVFGALAALFRDSITDFFTQLAGMRNVFVWLLVLGIVSSLMTHFVEIFNRRQVADMGFYFMYLLFARQTVENIILFVKLLVPAYLLTVGISTGSATAGAAYQMMLFAVYGVEYILVKGLLPFIGSYSMLTVVNGIWAEEKLSPLIDLLGKAVGWVLKGALGAVTGISIFQRLIAPVLDSARNSALQRLISAIPGVGAAAGGVVDMVVGSATVIRGSVGLVLLILLLLLCAVPVFKIAMIAVLLKCAAAFMGIVSDRRITACVNRIGDAAMLLLRTTGTAMLLFLVAIAVAAL